MLSRNSLYSNLFYLNYGILSNCRFKFVTYNLSINLIFHIFFVMKNINKHYNNVEVFRKKDSYINFLYSLHFKFFLSFYSNNILSNLLFTLNNKIVMFYVTNILIIKQNVFLCFLMHKNNKTFQGVYCG